MKKVIYIVAGLAIFFVAALVGLILWITAKTELDKNRSKTEAARNARWPKSSPEESVYITPPPPSGVVKKVDDLLDEINKKNNEEKI